MTKSYWDYPFHLDGRGRSAETGEDDHVRDLIHQVLFTTPGERVNRPEFGCGLKRLVFMPNQEALAAATQVTVHGALQRYLSRLIQVERVEVASREEQLIVRVVYVRRSTGERRNERFTASGII